ncbi:hypothetical protein CLU95_4079 [Variovorax sp. 54]|uniref:hypothetical protein n=1 Tax=Variovorax sp. 54 TaxID=2035212 RepID=UPI000C529227|nr:hypothetical protein [Variovorax sp. 54]PIF76910.1 hypothetical protein CLU95_4079 [Variovorax sp. 54]
MGASNEVISLKTYQDFYHQITGRTEQIKKQYSENLLIEFSDIEQLNHKIFQLCDIHHIVAKNEIISVFHDKDRKEVFTSFDRFKAYNTNSPNHCVSVVLKYNFSLIPAGLDHPQEYVVNVRLTSRIAFIRQLEEQAPPFMRGRLLGFVGESTAEISVDYADYVVARGYLEAFDEWIKGCKKTPKNQSQGFLTKWSYTIPSIAKTVGAILVTAFAWKAIPDLFSEPSNLVTLARFFVIYGGCGIIVINLMAAAGRALEDAIDCYPTLSYLKLNKGDENLISDFEKKKRGVVWKFFIAAASNIALGILASKLEKLI